MLVDYRTLHHKGKYIVFVQMLNVAEVHAVVFSSLGAALAFIRLFKGDNRLEGFSIHDMSGELIGFANNERMTLEL